MSQSTQKPTVQRILIERMESPIGVDVARPRVSWEVDSDRRGARQVGYQIVLGRAREAVMSGRGDIWDSGRVASDRSLDVRLGSDETFALPDHAKLWIGVRVWDEAGHESDWKASAFESGFVTQRWQPTWIGLDELRASAEANRESPEGLLLPPVVYLRRGFELQKKPVRATLYVASLGTIDTYLNGSRVTEDRYPSGWTDYRKRIYYRAYDVSDRLEVGSNVVGAMLGDGWFSGYIGWGNHRDHYGKHARFGCVLVMDHADGSRETISSDKHFRASDGPVRSADFLKGEVFDARMHHPGWCKEAFDDRSWRAVDVGTREEFPYDQVPVRWHPAPPVRMFETFTPNKISQPTEGRYVIDMGQNFAGVVRIRLTDTTPGQRVEIRHAERLNPDGTIYTTNLRGATSVDTYICRGGEEEIWEPRFTFHGFQYVELSGLTRPPTNETVLGVAISSDVKTIGSFESSEAFLNRLFKNIYYTQRANFIEVPTDCPQRDERLGWTADAQIYLDSACLIADVRAFFDKWMTDLIDAQGDDGNIPKVAPNVVAGPDGGPAWADAAVIIPWRIYEMDGDSDLLARCYPMMKRFVDFNVSRTREGLKPPEKFHCFGDWLNIDDPTPHDLLFSAYLAHSADLTARSARVLGLEEDARKYENLFERAAMAFRSFHLAEDGKLTGDSQTAYVLAIRFGLLDEAGRARAGEHLVANIARRGMHLSTGFVGTKDLLHALSDVGRSDVASVLLMKRTFPSWGFSIDHGATSIWERWDGWTPSKGFQDAGMNSFAHYAFGAVYQWMVRSLGGLVESRRSGEWLRLQMDFDHGLGDARVAWRGPRGWFESGWIRTGDGISWELRIPFGSTAKVSVKLKDGQQITEQNANMKHVSGVGQVARRGDWMDFEVSSGWYRFQIE